ncbi:MAG: ferric reductase-like transmembrane domain-containing protein [bacterium]
MPYKKAILTIITISAIPILIWLLMTPLSERFFDLNATTTSLGQITGLLGMILFSLNLILASRLKFLDNLFDGLNNVYLFHRVLGALSFSLLLFHPLFLVVKYLQISLRSAALFLLPSTDFAITSGIISLAGMIILISLTFYISLKYQNWKLSHKIMVLVFVFALMHTLLIYSDISRNLFLRIYILGFGMAGLALSAYQAFFHKYLSKNIYEVKDITRLNLQVLAITLMPKNQTQKFVPGQFVFVSFHGKNISSESHPFSVSASYPDGSFRLAIKALGDFTAILDKLQVGDRAIIQGPFGKFSYLNAKGKNQIWIAGGVGITPFTSMAQDLKNPDYHIDLYYCTKNQAEDVLIDELKKIAETNPSFRLFSWHSDEKGFITAENINSLSQELLNKEIFLCGPAPFMNGLIKQFKNLNIKNKNIHSEQFKFL